MKKWVLLPLVSLVLAPGSGQNRYYDSVRRVLQAAKNDTQRLAILDSVEYGIYIFTYPDTGLSYAYRGLLLAQKLQNPSVMANSLNDCGWGCVVLGRYPEALEYTNAPTCLRNFLHSTQNPALSASK